MIAWLAELTGFTCTAAAQQREEPGVAGRDATRDPVPLGEAQQKVPVAKQQGAETKQRFSNGHTSRARLFGKVVELLGSPQQKKFKRIGVNSIGLSTTRCLADPIGVNTPAR